MALLSYGEVVAISYTTIDTDITLTPEQLSVVIQVAALLVQPTAWSDYDTHAEEIDELIAGVMAQLTGSL